MEMTETLTRTRIMRRVRTAYVLKRLSGGVAASALLAAASLYALGREVWVAKIWQNMPSATHVSQFAHFFLAAFLNTQALVQVTIIAVLAAGFWFLVNVARSITLFTRFA